MRPRFAARSEEIGDQQTPEPIGVVDGPHVLRSKDPAIRLDAAIQGFAFAAEAGLRDHDRWRVAIEGFAQTHRGRRSTSHMPQLIEFVTARPLVTSATIARELRVSERSARDLVATLGLRELTGRGRYRAWGVL